MFQKYILKKMMQSQMKGVSHADQDALFAMIEKNPELFRTITEKAQAKIKQGKDQMTAIMETVQEYHHELKELMGK